MTSKVAAFRSIVWRHWKKHGRHDLPWRKTKDPYNILISEVMLQQTQVPRVLPKYKEFLRTFPTVRALANAPLPEVLKVWSGLGYNRRAKFLHEAARKIVDEYRGLFPKNADTLRALPGIGDYTAKAVCVFAFNQPHVLIETNIRTAIFHHFYRGESYVSESYVSDKEVLEIAEKGTKGQDPREWHSALMDYGAHLKASGVRLNARSKHYTKQSKFEGSLRQVRGVILKALVKGENVKNLKTSYDNRFDEAFASLVHDGLIGK